jgi:hypothetical protein
VLHVMVDIAVVDITVQFIMARYIAVDITVDITVWSITVGFIMATTTAHVPITT